MAKTKEVSTLISDYQIGADVEWFLQDKETEEIISAENLVQGTKEEPFKFDPDNTFYATSLDNVTVEGNIPPTTNPVDYYNSLQKVIQYIENSLENKYNVLSIPSAKLSPIWLQTENAQRAGCDISWNCWTGEDITASVNKKGYRGASFHIHVGYKDPDMDKNEALAKVMDLFLGVPAVIIEPENDRLKAGYGMSGNYRHQGHGMEYRTLSSYFSSSQELTTWCFETTQRAIQYLNDNPDLKEVNKDKDKIQEAINTKNIKLALELTEKYKLVY